MNGMGRKGMDAEKLMKSENNHKESTVASRSGQGDLNRPATAIFKFENCGRRVIALFTRGTCAEASDRGRNRHRPGGISTPSHYCTHQRSENLLTYGISPVG
ncbi:hypothetical protein AVEN_122051-1 [Araneus ventricosus]|uniref:Uncharacterized protein n=1 Tax=Araneus ventricosus TaxID=182803 RepID=A0A4Y2F2W4_ARAVE|nr:hypothetical protein AVEN_122051-1 [Araneus ventricosus]